MYFFKTEPITPVLTLNSDILVIALGEQMLQKLFLLEQKKATIKSELIGGLTTFLTMVYIVFVHPSVLADAGMDRNALITVTCVLVFISTLLVGLWANVPFAMAPGMGLNAFFTYSIVIGEGLSWQTALGVVFLSGVLFLILTLAGAREKIVDSIPIGLRLGTGAGIGLFITFIGLKKMGFVVDHPSTLVSIGSMSTELLIGCLAFLVMVILDIRGVRGAILYGIFSATILGLFFGGLDWPSSIFSWPPSPAPVAFQLDLLGAFKWSLVGVIFTFMFIDLFDSIGTILACSYEAGLIDKKGKLKEMPAVLKADAVATTIGALLGSSTTTTYIESASGIAAGAKTGLASVFTAFLFILTLFFSPIIAIVPDYAVAPALVLVGVYMCRPINQINFGKLRESVPFFLTMVLMPLTYSISTGLACGFISYVAIAILSGESKKVSPILMGIAVAALIMMILK